MPNRKREKSYIVLDYVYPLFREFYLVKYSLLIV